MTKEQIALVAHEVNKAYCESIGDTSQPEWAIAPDWQKTSAINGVNAHLSNPNMTPKQSHESWMAEKVATGWIYGEKKDPEKKEHPCIKPYVELPQEQRTKDFLFRQVVHSLKPYLDTDSGTLKFEPSIAAKETPAIESGLPKTPIHEPLPSMGRIIMFHPSAGDATCDPDKILPAIVTKVYEDRTTINCHVFTNNDRIPTLEGVTVLRVQVEKRTSDTDDTRASWSWPPRI